MRPYFMGYCTPVSSGRLAAFLKQEMDVNEITLFFQDAIEAQLIPALVHQVDERFYEHAQYYVEMGLCHVDARAKH